MLQSKLGKSKQAVAMLQKSLSASQAEGMHLKKDLSVAVHDPVTFKKDEDAAVSLLSKSIESKPPNMAFQHFASQILTKCLVDGSIKLRTKAKGRPITYKRVKGQRVM